MFQEPYTKRNPNLLSNLPDAKREIAELTVKEFPFLYIEDTARDIHGRAVKGYFALCTTQPRCDSGDVWRFYYKVKAEQEAATPSL